VDLSQPLLGADGAVVGVVGARLSWAFFAAQIHVLRDTLHTRRQPELWLIDAEGTVLQGPPEWRGRSFVPPTAEADAHWLHSALVPLEGDGGAGGLGWRVWVRDRASEALQASQTRRWTVFGVVLLAGLLAAAGAALAARLLPRRHDVQVRREQHPRRRLLRLRPHQQRRERIRRDRPRPQPAALRLPRHQLPAPLVLRRMLRLVRRPQPQQLLQESELRLVQDHLAPSPPRPRAVPLRRAI
jgi:hypothetical protein